MHYPQVRAIGGLGMPLLDWLERCALPEEARLADATYAAWVAADFVDGLARAGTTTALVFGSHFATAVDALFTEADRVGLRVTSGLVLSDRILREDLFTHPDRAYAEGLALADQVARPWPAAVRRHAAVLALLHRPAPGVGRGPAARRTRLRSSPRTSTRTPRRSAGVRELFGCDYTTSYDKHALLGPRSVLAHNVHPTQGELRVLGRRGVAVAHCPTSNAALGSGMFPLGAHLAFGVRVALGSDVGAGTGFSLFKEGLQAYFAQQLLGREGHRLTAGHLLHLATSAGADALGLADTVGDFEVGKEYDALWLRPEPGTTLDVALRHADSPDDALAKAFALAGTRRRTADLGRRHTDSSATARAGTLQTADESGSQRDSRASLDLAIAKPQPWARVGLGGTETSSGLVTTSSRVGPSAASAQVTASSSWPGSVTRRALRPMASATRRGPGCRARCRTPAVRPAPARA